LNDKLNAEGFDLTAQGQRVLLCILGGGTLLAIDFSARLAANRYAEEVGCPGVGGGSGLGGILSGGSGSDLGGILDGGGSGLSGILDRLLN
jgi:hypothetical protein